MPETPEPESKFDLPEDYFFEADKAIAEDRIAKAHQLLRGLLDRWPDFGKAYNHLAFIYETKYRDPAQAERFYLKCLETAPEYPAAYLNYAVLLCTQERMEDLLNLLEKAKNVPGINKSKLYNEYGIMHEVQGQFESARKHYRLAVQYSFSDQEIENYEQSIRRVEQKIHLLN